LLVRNVTATRDIPGELGQTMTFRQLGWRQLAEAEEARSATALRSVKNMGPEVFASLQSVDRTRNDQEAAKQGAADPLAKYDQATVLRYGIASWTYPDKLNADSIDSLDVNTAKWAATEIVNLGMPPIEAETEDRFLPSHDSSMATPATATIALRAGLDLPTNGFSA
jgi:predicted component of type VI protein secretion system